MLKWLARLFHRPKPTPSQEEQEPDLDEAAPVVLPITAALDLHTFSPREIADVTRSYLEEAHRAGLSQVRVIHGKGKGVQRARVHAILKQHPLVHSFQLAPPEQGGWGATLVWLTPGGPLA